MAKASSPLFTKAEEEAILAAALHDLGGPEADATKAPARIGQDGDEAAPRPRRGRWPGKRPKRLHALS